MVQLYYLEIPKRIAIIIGKDLTLGYRTWEWSIVRLVLILECNKLGACNNIYKNAI